MRDLFKKSWFIGTLISSIMLIVFFMNLWVMSLKLTSPYADDNLWSLASSLSEGDFINVFAFALRLVFYLSIVPLLLSVISFFKKNNWGFMIAVMYFLAFETAFIVFQTSYNHLSVFAIILVILNFILIVGMFILLILRNRMLSEIRETQVNERESKLSSTKIPLSVLIIDVVSIIVFLSTFFIPLYSQIEGGSTYHAIIVRVLFSGDTNIEVLVYFLANFVIFLSIFLYFSKCLSYYFFSKEAFILKSKTLITLIFVSTITFFLTGLTIDIVYTLQGVETQTSAYIPMLLMCIVIFSYAIFRGKYRVYDQTLITESKIGYAKIEPLVYVIFLTAVSVLMLFLRIIRIQISYGDYTNFVDLTGFSILRDYASLDPGYRIVAYMLVVMLISVGMSLVITLTSYLSKHTQFNSIVKLATIVNIFFVFIIAISSYYFQIAKEINQSMIIEIFDYYGINLPSALVYDYTVKSDAIYALITSVSILIVMFMRKAFDRDDMLLLENNALHSNSIVESNTSPSPNHLEDEISEQFDPCPAFTDLDSKIALFKQHQESRKTYKVENATLSDLVHFVVEYARNSRLHLSYTPEDIATFVAGLGASKLSILQGMSGTGKTSLPKIFSEAIFGNCEIIEVESSWKDKNELLGYYNEFSMKYTPKKFTLALYKAALNPEIFTFILLDEMNLSRIEYYFSDFLSLMENEEDQRELKLLNIKLTRKEKESEDDIEYLALENGNTLKVAPNVWFIGTANRDESTFVISDKVYDRSHTMNFAKRAPKVRNYLNPISRQYYDYKTLNNLFVEAKQNGNFDAEQSELIKHVETLLAPYNISFGNRILNQIEDFVNVYKACFPNEDVESKAIEKILLSKVVSKLEVKTIDDKESLETEFENLNLNQCVEFIKRLDNE